MRRRVGAKLPPSSPQAPTLTPEEEQELDFDVCCCIEEIQNTLLKNPTEKQKKSAEISLKILKNPSEIYFKKKQIMRQWFGDYKSKFAKKKKQVIFNLNNDLFTFKKTELSQNSMCFRKHMPQNAKNNKSTRNDECILINETNSGGDSVIHNERYNISASNNCFRFGF